MTNLIFPVVSGLIIIGLVMLIFRWLGKRERLLEINKMEKALALEGDEAFMLLIKNAKTLEEKEEILRFAKDKISEPSFKAPPVIQNISPKPESSFALDEEDDFNAENALNAIEEEEDDSQGQDEINLIWENKEFAEGGNPSLEESVELPETPKEDSPEEYTVELSKTRVIE